MALPTRLDGQNNLPPYLRTTLATAMILSVDLAELIVLINKALAVTASFGASSLRASASKATGPIKLA